MATIDALRDLLYARDGGICGICSKPVERSVMGIDHIQPRAHGGPDVFANLRTAHRLCNTRRGPGRIIKADPDPTLVRPKKTAACRFLNTELMKRRIGRGLSLAILAEKANITRVALARIEAGQAQPRPKTTRALAKALSVDVGDLMEPLDADD